MNGGGISFSLSVRKAKQHSPYLTGIFAERKLSVGKFFEKKVPTLKVTLSVITTFLLDKLICFYENSYS